MARSGEDKMSGLQKSAVLLIALGPEKSARIFKHLKEEEIEELTLEIANTRSITPQIKESIIEELKEWCAEIDEYLENIAKLEEEAKKSGEDLSEVLGGK